MSAAPSLSAAVTGPVHRHLFLDLEDTVIEPVNRGWHRTELVNTERVRAFIEEGKPTAVHLFSFALHNVHELSGFNQGTRPMLEAALGVKLRMTPTVDEDILPACCQLQGLSVQLTTFEEMVEFWGKQTAFKMFMRQRMLKLFPRDNFDQPLHAALLDDAVFDEEVSWPNENVHLSIKNVLML